MISHIYDISHKCYSIRQVEENQELFQAFRKKYEISESFSFRGNNIKVLMKSLMKTVC